MAPMIACIVSHGMAGLVGQAFFIAAATFAVTSVIGYTTKKDMTGLERLICRWPRSA